MKLSTDDMESFYRLFTSLLMHTNKKMSVLPPDEMPTSPVELMNLPVESRAKLRNKLWENAEELIHSFLDENPFSLTEKELETVGSWKHFVKDRFFVVSYLKKHAVFLDEEHSIAYGVLALKDDFEALIGPYLPVYVETVLLPFEGRIIYDGLISSYSISFGRGASRNITDSYQQAKAQHGIVTSLPFSKEEKATSDEDLLRFYLKSQQNRDRYWDDIWSLIHKKPVLRILYHQEMGKIHARTYKKRLKDSGIEKGWFGVLEANIVAVGRTEAELKTIMKEIVPVDKISWVHVFSLKK